MSHNKRRFLLFPFLLRVEIGYPPGEDELRIMKRTDSLAALESLRPILNIGEVLDLQKACRGVHVDESIARYMLAISKATRDNEFIQLGASPRGSLALYEAVQAHALVEGRDFATPDDVRTMVIPVLSHRILVKSRGGNLAASSRERARVIADIVKTIDPPI